MTDLIIDYTWLWVLITAIWGILFGVLYYRRRNEVKAQFVVISGTIGCLMACFGCIGAISALLTILACIMRFILWYIGAK